MALAIWWCGNTVAHRVAHRAMFRWQVVDAGLQVVTSLLLGWPQDLWRRQHLRHHGLRFEPTPADARRLGCQIAVLLAVGGFVATVHGSWLLAHYVPGWCLGMALAFAHGRGEHLGGAARDCGAGWWNLLWWNDGWHAAHHRHPGAHPLDLPRLRRPGDRVDLVPPPLRWLRDGAAGAALDALERLVLQCTALQRLVLALHRPALRRLLAAVPPPRTVVVVGGGLFPRTAILLRELLPAARIVVVDAERGHLERARSWLPPGIEVRCARHAPGECFTGELACDLAVLPLALRGDRGASYRAPAAPFVLVHDWLWRRRGVCGCAIPWLGKRLNLVVRGAKAPGLREAS